MKAPKSSFFHCEEYMKAKLMSRVLDVVGEMTENRGRTRTQVDMDFLNVCHTKAPSGQTTNNLCTENPNAIQFIRKSAATGNNYQWYF